MPELMEVCEAKGWDTRWSGGYFYIYADSKIYYVGPACDVWVDEGNGRHELPYGPEYLAYLLR